MALSDYRTELKAQYQQRAQANGSYSLRAFARDCGLSASFLSNVLNGRKQLSEAKAFEIANRIFRQANQRKNFVSKVRLANCESSDHKQSISEELETTEEPTDIKIVDEDKMALVSDWLHGVVLEFAKMTPIGTIEIETLASQLSVQIQKIEMTVQRLKRLNLLSENVTGALVPTNNHVHLPSMPSSALNNYHKQIIKKSAQALDENSRENRYFESSSLALDEESFAKLKTKIMELQEFAMLLSEKSTHPTRIAQLNTQIFSMLERLN